MKKQATPLEIVMIAAVRADEKVGEGTGSSIDEKFNDDELLGLLRRRSADDPHKAVKTAREQEELHRIKVGPS